jgi:hypothetical protein
MFASRCLLTLSAVAKGILKANRFVTYGDVAAGAGAPIKGVALYDAGIGDDVAIQALGEIAVEAGGVIAAGDPIISDADGRAVTDAGTSPNRFGRALSATTAAGQPVIVLTR